MKQFKRRILTAALATGTTALVLIALRNYGDLRPMAKPNVAPSPIVPRDVTSSSPAEGPSYYQSSSSIRMADRLEKLARDTDPAMNRYVNHERVRLYNNKPLPSNRDQRTTRLIQVADELLYAGQTEEAVSRYKNARAFIQRYQPFNRRYRNRLLLDVREALAISYLRLGEQENCIAQHNVDSCLLPIQNSGVHAFARGSRAAIGEYSELLKERPENLDARWLLNIAYMTIGEYPDKVPPHLLVPPKAFESDYDIKRFYDVAPRLGLDVVGLAGGSIMEDFDADGDLDIMCSSWGLRDQLRYFQNNADGTFSERTKEAGLLGIVGGLNMVHADYDNDGNPDVLVLRGAWLNEPWADGEGGRHPNSLLRNNGNGTFDDVTEEAGLLTFHPTQTAAWGDYDNDGWIDLFIGNESIHFGMHASELFHNNGDGTFTDVAKQAGVKTFAYVKGTTWGDYDNDGRLDLYVSALLQPNILYRNNGPNSSGQWTLSDTTEAAGVAEPRHSFPTWFWDYNNDGWLDIFVSGYDANIGPSGIASDYLRLSSDAPRARLYQNNHDGTFSDVTEQAQLKRVLLTMGCNYGDLDNDGFLDFYVGTGTPKFQALIPNLMFRNDGGKLFQDVTTSGGFGHLQKGHGISFGDVDNDGDQDIYAVMGGAYAGDFFQNVLFENPGHGNHWITLRLEGRHSNRSAIGVRIKITVDSSRGRRNIHRTVTTGSSFGASSLQQEIGLGDASTIMAIDVNWPTTGAVQRFENIAMDQIITIREGDDVLIHTPAPIFTLSVD